MKILENTYPSVCHKFQNCNAAKNHICIKHCVSDVFLNQILGII